MTSPLHHPRDDRADGLPALLADLVRAKAAFQLRTILAVLNGTGGSA